jgi:hypothetical protein
MLGNRKGVVEKLSESQKILTQEAAGVNQGRLH